MHGYHPITKITSKYSLTQLQLVSDRDLIAALKSGITLDDYIDLIK